MRIGLLVFFFRFDGSFPRFFFFFGFGNLFRFPFPGPCEFFGVLGVSAVGAFVGQSGNGLSTSIATDKLSRHEPFMLILPFSFPLF